MQLNLGLAMLLQNGVVLSSLASPAVAAIPKRGVPLTIPSAVHWLLTPCSVRPVADVTLMMQVSAVATDGAGQSPRLVHSIAALFPIFPFMLEFTAAAAAAHTLDGREDVHLVMNLAATCSAAEMPCTLATKAWCSARQSPHSLHGVGTHLGTGTHRSSPLKQLHMVVVELVPHNKSSDLQSASCRQAPFGNPPSGTIPGSNVPPVHEKGQVFIYTHIQAQGSTSARVPDHLQFDHETRGIQSHTRWQLGSTVLFGRCSLSLEVLTTNQRHASKWKASGSGCFHIRLSSWELALN
jgi:hypothetical protein